MVWATLHGKCVRCGGLGRDGSGHPCRDSHAWCGCSSSCPFRFPRSCLHSISTRLPLPRRGTRNDNQVGRVDIWNDCGDPTRGDCAEQHCVTSNRLRRAGPRRSAIWMARLYASTFGDYRIPWNCVLHADEHGRSGQALGSFGVGHSGLADAHLLIHGHQ